MSKIALVTGGSSGIGRAACISLYSAGWDVVLTGRRKDALEETVRLMKANLEPTKKVGGGRVRVVTGDLKVEEDVREVFRIVKEEFGRLDLLFNNAGISSKPIPMETIPLSKFKEVVDVNLIAPFLCAQLAVEMMKSQSPQGGRIINNASISAYVPRPHSAPYTMTKHAISGLTKCIALDGRPFKIACSQLDIATEIQGGNYSKLQPDGSMREEPSYDVKYAGEAVLYMACLPLEINVLNQTVMATNMPFVGRG